MRQFVWILFLFSALQSYGHGERVLEFENVQLKSNAEGTTLYFSLHNLKLKCLEDVEVIFRQKNYEETIRIERILATDSIYSVVKLLDRKVDPTNGFELEVSSIYGKRNQWVLWSSEITEKQVNTLGSEFYADAPWRMKKYDAQGNIQGIPVHFFLHDSDLTAFGIKVDNINIQVKSASSPTFGPVLTYDLLPSLDYLSMFSCLSPQDADLDIKAFDLGSFVASATQTIDFNDDSDLFDTYELVDNTYWYFTFTIPPYDLAGLDNAVDILVTLEYANLTMTDDVVGLRVFRSDYDMPSLDHFYRGDTHLHSMYTQNDAEIGLPLEATKRACSLTGQDWVTTTDHTSDYDNYGSSISSNWNRIKMETEALNGSDPSFVFVRGLELAVKNGIDELVHMLTYPNPDNLPGMPFVGDGNGDVIPTSYNITTALNTINAYNGFAYLAHPFATGDELPAIPVDGGIYNIGHQDFPLNGAGFPIDGGSIICNDPSVPSDVLSTNPQEWIKEGLSGGQIWNARYNLIGFDDELDPYALQGASTPFGQMDTTSEEFHFRRFRQGQEVINFLNCKGLALKNLNPSLENWKFYYSAGTDAHGSFNFSNTDDFANLGKITNNAVGVLSTVAYCPDGMGQQGEKVLAALRDGHTTLSDGPLLAIGLSIDGSNSQNECIMGESISIHNASVDQAFINLDYASSPEFGDVEKIRIVVGTASGEIPFSVSFTVLNGNANIALPLQTTLESIYGVGNIPEDQYMYVRAELTSQVDYSGFQNIRMTDYDIFHSITNPVWFQITDITGISDLHHDVFEVYPNPFNEEVTIKLAQEACSSLEVYDGSGKMLLEKDSCENEIHLDFSDYSSGLYHLRLRIDGKSYHSKLEKL